MLARGGGYLMITASAAGLLTELDSAPYAVTKHAAVALAEWLAITYGDQGGAVDLADMATAQITQTAQDIAHQPGHRRLACAGVAQEHTVQGRRGRRAPQPGAFALDLKHVDQPGDLFLDAGQSDHAVQLAHRLIE